MKCECGNDAKVKCSCGEECCERCWLYRGSVQTVDKYGMCAWCDLEAFMGQYGGL